ncbi:MAG: hypothetical protein K1X94_16220 [Sandaracinaceae bacterium]|nr:hypothetical protein [Sandaracinaceae bacterium]
MRTLAHGPVLSLAIAALALGLVAAPASEARADDPGGSIVGQLYVSDGDVGGGGMIDVWGAIGPLRLGGFFGVAAVPSGRDWHNRTMMPAGVHVSLAIDLSAVDLVIVARGGLWGGASQEAKMLVGGLVGGGAYVDVALDGGIALGAGAEVLGLFGGGDTWAVIPGLRLTWGRAVPSTPSVEITAETSP